MKRIRASGAAAAAALTTLAAVPSPLSAQDATPASGRVQTAEPVRGSEFWIPFFSVIVPGLGQYIHHAPLAGLGYTGTAVAGAALGSAGDADPVRGSGLPRRPRDQLSWEGYHLRDAAGFVSAWDAFHRAVPALREAGRYGFLPGERESLGDLLTAPFDPAFLRRPTTLIHLAYTGLVTGFVLGTRDGEQDYEPFRWHDAAFATSLSLNAGVGEEAAFRGWLLPMLYQKTGQRFWLANSLQAGIFGAGHPQAEAFALVIAAWAGYEGWLTRRNEWSVRESVFHHFWYDVAAVVTTFLVDEREVRVHLSLPAPRF